MRCVIQRVHRASVSSVSDGRITGSIDKGLFILVGFKKGDAEAEADYCAQKIVNLRIFSDEKGMMNKSVQDTNGAILIVSQFTLYGNVIKGNRPAFGNAEESNKAQKLYEYFVQKIKALYPRVQTGTFGAHMEIEARCDGPVTILIER